MISWYSKSSHYLEIYANHSVLNNYIYPNTAEMVLHIPDQARDFRVNYKKIQSPNRSGSKSECKSIQGRSKDNGGYLL